MSGGRLPLRGDRFAPLPPGDAAELLFGVTAHDPVRALSLAFVPDEVRAAALAACAFVAEAASIPARVTDPTLGLVRVQWWREALDEAFGDGPLRAHPLARALRSAVPSPHRRSLEAVLEAVPPFLDGGGGEPLALLDTSDGALSGLLARLMRAEADAALACRAGALAAFGHVSAAPPPAARSPQIETPRQRAARVQGRTPSDVMQKLAELREAWPKRPADGLVVASLPLALTPAHARDRVPGPLGARLAMTWMTLRGRP